VSALSRITDPVAPLILPLMLSGGAKDNGHSMVTGKLDHLPINGKVAGLLFRGKPLKLFSSRKITHSEEFCRIALVSS